ncbi:MAG: hypothetical protein GVY11_01070 [Gammaproteobacteria bacterium]|jgi:uncharacterized lipoprotein|nr:hypothetical protein [Gammaproteobacteria bacterium]
MRVLTTLLALLAALALSACASAPEPRSPTVVDKDYVGAVESKARYSGVDVYWVNPPRKERETESDKPD